MNSSKSATGKAVMRKLVHKRKHVKQSLILKSIDKALELSRQDAKGLCLYRPVRRIADPREALNPAKYFEIIKPKRHAERGLLIVMNDEDTMQVGTTGILEEEGVRILRDEDPLHGEWNSAKMIADKSGCWRPSLS